MSFIKFCVIIWVVSLTCNVFSDISVNISIMDFPGGSVVTNLPDDAVDAKNAGSFPGSGRFSGVGNGNLLQYFCWENPRNRGAWQSMESHARLYYIIKKIIGKLSKVPWGKMLAISYLGTACIPKSFS